MRIGLVLSQTPGYSETFFNTKIQGLKENGFEVILFAQVNQNNFNACQVVSAPKVYRNKLRGIVMGCWVLLKLLRKLPILLKFIKLEKQAGRGHLQILKNSYTNAHILMAKVDWLHFGFATMALNSEYVAKAIGAKMAVSFRGFDMDIYPKKHQNCYQEVWNQVDNVHSISKYLLQEAVNEGLSNKTKYQIIPPSIDINRFQTSSNNDTTLNSKWKIITVARLHWIKGLMETLEALAILNENGIDFQYTVVGKGAMLESLIFARKQLKLENRVRFLGHLEHHKVVGLMAGSDIYIQYSHSEGFCNAVLEAQAMQLLTIVSDGGGLPENVIHNKTGWVVPKRQPKLLAQMILDITRLHKKELNDIRKSARLRVEKQFPLEKQKKAFKEFYENN